MHVWRLLPEAGTDFGKYKSEPYSIAMKQWADEMGIDIEPRAGEEDFFRLCMLEIGDPTLRTGYWTEFQQLRCQYYQGTFYEEDGERQQLTYMLWYQREKDRGISR